MPPKGVGSTSHRAKSRFCESASAGHRGYMPEVTSGPLLPSDVPSHSRRESFGKPVPRAVRRRSRRSRQMSRPDDEDRDATLRALLPRDAGRIAAAQRAPVGRARAANAPTTRAVGRTELRSRASRILLPRCSPCSSEAAPGLDRDRARSGGSPRATCPRRAGPSAPKHRHPTTVAGVAGSRLAERGAMAASRPG